MGEGYSPKNKWKKDLSFALLDFEIGSHYVTPADLKLSILLPQLIECQDDRSLLLWPAEGGNLSQAVQARRSCWGGSGGF